MIERAKQIQGWMAEGELRWLAEQSAMCNTVLELGAWKGRSTVAMAMAVKDYCISIDTFGGTPGDPGHDEALLDNGDCIYNQFTRNTWDFQRAGTLVVFRCRGDSASQLVRDLCGQVDLAFIDAAHDPQSVCRDVELFRPLVRSGGILAGHDWNWAGMGEALESVGITKPSVAFTIWWIRVQ